MEVYSVISLTESIRSATSSRGVFSELLLRIIYSGGIVYGAAYNKKD